MELASSVHDFRILGYAIFFTDAKNSTNAMRPKLRNM